MNRSKYFNKNRLRHKEESAEDYTELIYDLIVDKGEARVVDIASMLGVSHVTAIKTLSRLDKRGFIITTPRLPVKLTGKGLKLALYCKKRHSILVDFLIKIGVPTEVAETDAEGIEHHVSKITLKTIKSHIEQLT